MNRVEQLGERNGHPNLLSFTAENWENYLDDEDEGNEDIIRYGSMTEIQDEAHDNVEKITGVESEDNNDDNDLA